MEFTYFGIFSVENHTYSNSSSNLAYTRVTKLLAHSFMDLYKQYKKPSLRMVGTQEKSFKNVERKLETSKQMIVLGFLAILIQKR